MANLPIIRLYDFIGIGLILPFPSGVLYVNQTGGHACLQSEAEGMLVPLHNDLALDPIRLLGPEPDLLAYFTGPKHNGAGATSGLDEVDANQISAIIARHRLDSVLEMDRSRLIDSHEAWLHVIVRADDSGSYPAFAGFGPYPRPGILTWTNSD
jgi:hypothetical protein